MTEDSVSYEHLKTSAKKMMICRYMTSQSLFSVVEYN